MLRFSLATLLLVVLFVAIGCAALVNATEIWRQAIVTLTIVVLVVATLAATCIGGRTRPFVVGFSVAGWIYLVLVSVSALELRDDLLTDKAISLLFKTMHGDAESNVISFTGDSLMIDTPYSVTGLDTSGMFGGTTPMVNNATQVNYFDFSGIGHALCTMIVAFVGGWIVFGLTARQHVQKDSAE